MVSFWFWWLVRLSVQLLQRRVVCKSGRMGCFGNRQCLFQIKTAGIRSLPGAGGVRSPADRGGRVWFCSWALGHWRVLYLQVSWRGLVGIFFTFPNWSKVNHGKALIRLTTKPALSLLCRCLTAPKIAEQIVYNAYASIESWQILRSVLCFLQDRNKWQTKNPQGNSSPLHCGQVLGNCFGFEAQTYWESPKSNRYASLEIGRLQRIIKTRFYKF